MTTSPLTSVPPVATTGLDLDPQDPSFGRLSLADLTQAQLGLLRAADDAGLPEPYQAESNRYAPWGHPQRTSEIGGIIVMLDSLADLIAWSTWLEAPIGVSARTDENVHHVVYGHAGPVPVAVRALVPREAGDEA